jgi:hypothetical protein
MRVRAYNRYVPVAISLGGEVIKLSEDIKTRALVFRLASGEREALITNLGEDEMEEEAFHCQQVKG